MAHWSSLTSTSALLSLARVAGAGTGFLAQLVLARMLDADELGLFYSISSIASIGALVVTLGYPNIAPRFISRYRERGRQDRVAGFIHRARRDTVIWSLVAIAVISLVALAVPGVATDARYAIVVSAITILPIAAQRNYSAVAMAYRRFAVSHLPAMTIRPAIFVVLLVGLWALGVPVSVVFLMVLTLITYLAAGLMQYLPLRTTLNQGKPAETRRIRRRWRSEAWPLVMVSAFTGLLSELSVLLAAPFMDLAQVAAFGICLRIAFLVGYAVQAAHQVVVPDIGDAFARREGGKISATMLGASLFPLAVTIVALLLSIVAGDKLLGLFGEEFRSAQMTLNILLVAQLVRALAGPSPFVLTLKGAQGLNAIICTAAMAVLLVGNAVLATRWGAEGAAISVLITTVVWLAGSAWALHRVGGARADLAGLLMGRRQVASPAE